MATHTPGPWKAEFNIGAGWEIKGTLPKGFRFDGTTRDADGATWFQTWVLANPATILVSCERWVQFETQQWTAMQAGNARLIAAAPHLLEVAEMIIKWDDAERNAGSFSEDNGGGFIARCNLFRELIGNARSVVAKVNGAPCNAQ